VAPPLGCRDDTPVLDVIQVSEDSR
jgi:hypothetical protein